MHSSKPSKGPKNFEIERLSKLGISRSRVVTQAEILAVLGQPASSSHTATGTRTLNGGAKAI